MTIRYTARDGGQPFADAVTASAKSQLKSIALAESRKGLYRLFSARQEYGSNWARFLNPASGNDQVLAIDTAAERFAFFTHGMQIKIMGIDVFSRTADSSDFNLVITPPKGTAQTVAFSADPQLNDLHHWTPTSFTPVPLGSTPTPAGTAPPVWTIKLQKGHATDFRSLTPADLDDIILVLAYQAL